MNLTIRPSFQYLLMASILGGLCGCSTQYKRHWNHAAHSPASDGGLTGRWEGRWLSDKNGHNGKLRCIIRQTGDNEFEFHYWARFWKFFTASYRITVTAERSGGDFRFRGSKHLGFFYGGLYSHEGEVSGEKLSATYECKIDHGRFDLERLDDRQVPTPSTDMR